MTAGKTKATTCLTCNGKGHVFDSGSLFVPIFGWIAALCETNSPRGFTREQCPNCEGKGYLNVG